MKKSLIFLILIFSFWGGKMYHILAAPPTSSKISFWNRPQKGTNIFSQHPIREDIRAAKRYGIAFIRLAPDKFISSERDFLIGNADHYKNIPAVDLAKLVDFLDICSEENMPVVLAVLSLPGCRWKQNNDEKDDLRLWSNPEFQKQAEKFWQDLATHLKDHPAVVGYNILNEPHLERIYDTSSINITQINQQEIQKCLYQFYCGIIKGIRSVDQETPIILDSSSYADPQTFKDFRPHNEDNIIYSFHMYEPFTYTNVKMNGGKFTYPGTISGKYWNKKVLHEYMSQVIAFQKKHGISSSRILVGEFGGHRTSKGLTQYFQDLIDIFKENNWHFAFYAFREDTWDGMDYELGEKKLPGSYWKATAKDVKPKLERRGDHPAFKVITPQE